MNLDIINAFLKVAEKGSLSKAASEINISQSALSKQMIYLEEYLHKTLLHRSFKGVSLTPDGEITFKYFIKIKSELQHLNDSLNQSRSPVFGATPTIGLKIHQIAIERQITHNILLSENIDHLINLYLAGKIDILFLADNEYPRDHFPSTSKDCFACKIPTYIIVHKLSPLYTLDIVTISDLHKYPCIFYNGTQLMFQTLNTDNLFSVFNKNTLSDKYLFEIICFISKNPEYFSFSYVNHNMMCNDIKKIEVIDAPYRLLTAKLHDAKYEKHLLAIKENFSN